MNDHHWMQLAYQQALLARDEGEVPVGAVLVSQQGELLASGRNKVQTQHDPSLHAELIAISEAAQKTGNQRLSGSTLYVTLEPCPMCAGLMVLARIKRLVFASRDFKSGAAGSVFNLLQGAPLNHQVLIDEGVMQQDCADLLSGFFKYLRYY